MTEVVRSNHGKSGKGSAGGGGGITQSPTKHTIGYGHVSRTQMERSQTAYVVLSSHRVAPVTHSRSMNGCIRSGVFLRTTSSRIDVTFVMSSASSIVCTEQPIASAQKKLRRIDRMKHHLVSRNVTEISSSVNRIRPFGSFWFQEPWFLEPKGRMPEYLAWFSSIF